MNNYFSQTRFSSTYQAKTQTNHVNYHTMELVIRYVYKANTVIILLIIIKVLLCVIKIYYWTLEFPLNWRYFRGSRVVCWGGMLKKITKSNRQKSSK